MDMSQYRELFVDEAREHLRLIGDTILLLEKDGGNGELIGSLFRAAHSLKGMAASMDYGNIAALAHGMEDLMDGVRKGNVPFDSGVADLFLEGADFLGVMVDAVEGGQVPGHDTSDLLQRFAVYGSVKKRSEETRRDEIPQARESVQRAPSSGIMPYEAGKEAVAGEGRAGAPQEPGESQRTVRVRTDILDRLINVTGELVTARHRLMSLGEELGSERLLHAVGNLSHLVRELHNDVMAVRMMPFAATSERLPRMVRDLAKRSGKEVSFTIEGQEIELDRGILEALSDPLIHILRNAVDHGIESPAERTESGKAPEGAIRLTVGREKDHVVVSIADDGRGMDPEGLVRAAVDKGLISADSGKGMSPAEAFMLTCLPGFSTASAVTDVSGRGVGMDAVHAAVKQLGGVLSIESEKWKGSRIILRLPLTVAIVQVLLVSCGAWTVAVPVTAIHRTIDLELQHIRHQEKMAEFHLDGETVQLVSLNHIMGLSPGVAERGMFSVIVTQIRGRTVGLVVDAFLGQTEVYVKPLGRPLSRMKGLYAGAILGDGQVIFILDIPNLL